MLSLSGKKKDKRTSIHGGLVKIRMQSSGAHVWGKGGQILIPKATTFFSRKN